MIQLSEISISGPRIIQVNPFIDERGFFGRLFCKKTFGEILGKRNIVQVNHSFTKNKGSVRGMHFQHPPHTETKIIKCLKGKILDILVDIRKCSPTFLQWYGIELSESNNKMILIPDGFAHGFQTLEDDTELLYFHTAYYNPEAEGGLKYDDPKIGINWRLKPVNLSNRDSNFENINKNFKGIEV